jgi:flagellar biosynthesis protein FlhF
MNVRRYTAADMRGALNLVRIEHGPDAVIIGNRRVGNLVEVTVAIDSDEAHREHARGIAPPAPPPAHTPAPLASAGEGGRDANALLTQPQQLRTGTADGAGVLGFAATLEARAAARREDPPREPAGASSRANDGSINEELRTLRRMLETQLATLAWNDLTRRAPLATELLRELTEFGFSQDVAAQVADALPVNLDFTRARRLALARLADRLAVSGDRWGEFGGTVALVGPSGVGKTSALARLATRWTMRHGTGDLALIGADSQRLGAHEHIARLGRLIGAPTFCVEGAAEIPDVLARLHKQRLILIDTTGVSPRSPDFESQMNALRAGGAQVEIALTLSAASQSAVIEETVARFGAWRPAACILTKLDEAVSLGGALSAVMRAGLPIAYTSEAGGLADELRPARSLDLICRAVQLAEQFGAAADDDMLARRFGGTVHAAS